jgi:peptidoglycan/LPS O-acetylase OafA/YrhL
VATAKDPRARFASLDGCRGAFALIVALSHFDVAGYLYDLPLVRNGYLAVDFFFVLSGFVISHASHDRLSTPRGVLSFMVRRFGRVWPLHAVMLGCFVGSEFLKLYAQNVGHVHAARAAFAPGSQFDPWAIPENLALIHSLNLHSYSTWNLPSWSISTEFYTYVLFAVCSFVVRRRTLAASLVLVLSSAGFLFAYAPNIDETYHYGFVRCVYGFFCGVIVYRAYRALPAWRSSWATPIEIAWVVGVLAFISIHGADRWSLLAPVVFMGPIWIFAAEAGDLSTALKSRPMQAIGRWSYAIYMIHAFVFQLLQRATMVISKHIDRPITVSRGAWADGTPMQLIKFGDPWLMDVFSLAMLGVVVALAAAAHRYIEMPSQRPFQILARKLEAADGPRASAAATAACFAATQDPQS